MKKNVALSLFLLLMTGLSTTYAQSVKDYIQNDRTLIWRTSSQGSVIGEGELSISNVINNTFEAGQTNKDNLGAGTQVLRGGIFNGDQQVVLLNMGDYREVWVGMISGDRITGTIEGTAVTFEIRLKRVKPLQWVAYSGSMPANTVSGGFENGTDQIVCRSFYNGANHPGKVVGAGCNIGWGGKEIVSQTYEVLINETEAPLQWLTYTGSIPNHAVIGGVEGDKNYYVGQCTRADGSVHAGKVFGTPGNYIFNYGYGGKEITEKNDFRILVQYGR